MKIFIRSEQLRDNVIRLAQKIYSDGFIPDIIYVSLRGGAIIGNIISEYFKLLHKGAHPIFYAAVIAHSYMGVDSQEDVHVEGWTYSPKHLRKGDKILLVDDIFDSGNTIRRLLEIIQENGVLRKDIRVAVHDYKLRVFQQIPQSVHPDYYCNKYVIEQPEDEKWIHYLSHEIEGLGPEEIDTYYNADIASIIKDTVSKAKS